jgi:signal transduction protein with GAF and PtsI domain
MRPMHELGRGQKVFDHPPVQGVLRVMESRDDVIDLLDELDDGVVADGEVVVLVRDAGATFLAPLYHELAGIICTAGTLRSHIGIVSREHGLPCVMGCEFTQVPESGATVELDCSGPDGIVRG